MNGEGKDGRLGDTNDQITLTTTQARQGATPHVIRYALGWGLALVTIAFALVYFLQRYLRHCNRRQSAFR